jgi:hypothetical protein
MVFFIQIFLQELCIHVSPMLTVCLAYVILPYFITLVIHIGEECTLLITSVCKFLQPLIISLFLSINSSLSNLITLNVCSSLTVRDKVSVAWRTESRFLALYEILIFISILTRVREWVAFWARILRPSHAPRIYHCNNACSRKYIVKLLIIPLSQSPYCFFYLRSKYSPQHFVLIHPQSTL